MAQIGNNADRFGFGSHRRHFTACQSLGIDGEILLGIVIVADFLIVFHHQKIGGCEDIALSIMDGTADIVHSGGSGSTAYSLGVQSTENCLIHGYQFLSFDELIVSQFGGFVKGFF